MLWHDGGWLGDIVVVVEEVVVVEVVEVVDTLVVRKEVLVVGLVVVLALVVPTLVTVEVEVVGAMAFERSRTNACIIAIISLNTFAVPVDCEA